MGNIKTRVTNQNKKHLCRETRIMCEWAGQKQKQNQTQELQMGRSEHNKQNPFHQNQKYTKNTNYDINGSRFFTYFSGYHTHNIYGWSDGDGGMDGRTDGWMDIISSSVFSLHVGGQYKLSKCKLNIKALILLLFFLSIYD